MIMYLLLAMFPVILTPVVNSVYKSSINSNEKAKRTFLLCCGALLFMMIAFRSRYVGTVDSQRYYNNWLYLQDVPKDALGNYLSNNEMESFYLLTVWVLSHIFPSAQWLFVFSGILFTVAVCYFIYKNSDDPCISFLMFVSLGLYTFMVQGLRQAIAMSICLLSVELLKNKKYIRFFLVVLLASLFHKTAIVFLVVFLIHYLKMNWYSYAFVGAASAVVFAYSGYIVEKSKIFFNEEDYTDTATSGGFIAAAIYVIILAVALILSSKSQKKNKQYSFFFYMTYLGFCAYMLRFFELGILERVSYYFLFGQMILLPNSLKNIDKRIAFLIKIAIIVLCILLFAYRLSTSDLIPFTFCWQDYLSLT